MRMERSEQQDYQARRHCRLSQVAKLPDREVLIPRGSGRSRTGYMRLRRIRSSYWRDLPVAENTLRRSGSAALHMVSTSSFSNGRTSTSLGGRGLLRGLSAMIISVSDDFSSSSSRVGATGVKRKSAGTHFEGSPLPKSKRIPGRTPCLMMAVFSNKRSSLAAHCMG
jgi:hypothetical protein